MEHFEELQHQNNSFDNVYGLYVNNPNQMSYLLFLANQKKENLNLLNGELSHYFDLMTSLLFDYAKGNYKKVPIKTIIFFVSALSSFVFPKKTTLDIIPGVKLIKQFGLIKLLLQSFKNDLMKYEYWKKNQNRPLEV